MRFAYALLFVCLVTANALADPFGSIPDLTGGCTSSTCGIPDEVLNWHEPASAATAEPAQAEPSPPASSQMLPAHVHRTPSGQLAPDSGCGWVNSADPNDFRVRCP